MEPKDLVVFDGDNIRRTWINDELWFSASDIIKAFAQTKEKKETEKTE